MNSSISKIALIILSILNTSTYATNFYTKVGGAGLYSNSSNWVGGAAGTPGTNTGYSKYSGTNDTIFINHPITSNSTFEFGGSSVVVVIGSGGSLSINTTKNLNLNNSKIIVNGGTLNVSGNFTTSNPSLISIKNNGVVNVSGNMSINNTTLTIENGCSLNVSGSFTTGNTSGSSINLSGNMTVGNGMSGIAGTWNIASTGKLKVTGNLVNDTGGTTFNIAGEVSVSGNTSFHSGNYNIASGGSYTSNGTGEILFGAANITNNGNMNFPNATTSNKYGGNFDCDGSGSGSVGFGSGAFCGSVCSGGSSGRCVDNGVPLPIELNYFHVSIEENNFIIDWETISEKNNDYFTIEYSTDLYSFTALLEEDGAGYSLSPIQYTVSSPVFGFNTLYFRLKQTDYDGNFTYSQIVALNSQYLVSSQINLYPNPTAGKTVIQITSDITEPVIGTIVSPTSLSIMKTFVVEKRNSEVDFSDLENGVYFMNIMGITGSPFKLVIQK